MEYSTPLVGIQVQYSATRPVIASMNPDGVMTYNTAAEVTVSGVAGSVITKVSLVRLGSVTHGIDMDTRFVPLNFQATTPDTLSVTAPAHGFIAPPGYYMLFILKDGDRPNVFVPSKAKIIKLQSTTP